jgi:dipeptidase E
MDHKNLLIASTSTVYGTPYLEYLSEAIINFFLGSKEIIFIPFARPGGATLSEYTNVAKSFFQRFDMRLIGIHESNDMNKALSKARGIFVGGGNTFLLLKTLYDHNLLEVIKNKINEGVPYLGTSAGSNILGKNIKTTNDMPIVYPPSFDAIQAVPFNINPHYTDPNPESKHMGETRETRIKEFLKFNDTAVVGLREGSYLNVVDDRISLGGRHKAKIFQPGSKPIELAANDDLSFLLNQSK